MTRRDEKVRILSARAWADLLVLATGASSLSSAERQLFGESHFRKSAKGNSVRPCTLRRWCAGVVPNDSTLLRMNRRVLGSLHFYCHPLWKILQCMENPPDQLLYPLPPAVCELLFSRESTGPTPYPTLKNLDTTLFEAIETVSTMDGLAALVFCVKRLAHERNFTVATQAMKSFYRLALMLGVFRPLACVTPQLITLVCRDFPLSWAAAHWLPEPEIERLASQSVQLLASELLGDMALLPTDEKRLNWAQIGKMLTTLLGPRAHSCASHAYNLSLLLEDGANDSTALRPWGDITLAWMGVDELAPPVLWTSRPGDKSNFKECDFSGFLFASWMEVESHTVQL